MTLKHRLACGHVWVEPNGIAFIRRRRTAKNLDPLPETGRRHCQDSACIGRRELVVGWDIDPVDFVTDDVGEYIMVPYEGEDSW